MCRLVSKTVTIDISMTFPFTALHCKILKNDEGLILGKEIYQVQMMGNLQFIKFMFSMHTGSYIST